MIPLYGFRQGDCIGLVILAEPNDTIAILASKLQSAAQVRVRVSDRVRVIHRGRVLAPDDTVAHAGFTALERFDVVDANDPAKPAGARVSV